MANGIDELRASVYAIEKAIFKAKDVTEAANEESGTTIGTPATPPRPKHPVVMVPSTTAEASFAGDDSVLKSPQPPFVSPPRFKQDIMPQGQALDRMLSRPNSMLEEVHDDADVQEAPHSAKQFMIWARVA